MEFTKALAMRQSVREFKDEQITDEQLQAVINAAYFAPVGMAQFDNIRLIAIKSQEVMAALREELAKNAPPQMGDPSRGAAALIYVCQKADDPEALAFSNTGAIMETMLLAAANEGIGAFYMMGGVMMNLGNEKVNELIQLPEGFAPRAAIALGVPAAPVVERELVPNKLQTIVIA